MSQMTVFSEMQRKTVATALTLLATVFVVLVVAAVLVLLGCFLSYFSHVFMPIVVAAIAALVMKPYYKWTYQHTGQRAVLAVLLVYASILLPLMAFAWFFGSILVEQAGGLLRQGIDLARTSWERLMEHWPEWREQVSHLELDQRLEAMLEEQMDVISGAVLTAFKWSLSAGAGAFRFITGLFSWAIFPIYMGFFLASQGIPRSRWEDLLPFCRAQLRQDIVYLGEEFINIMVSFFRGQLVIAFLQGLLYALGFSVIGLKYGFVIGLLLGLLNIVPYLGSIIGLSVVLPLALFQVGGGWGLVLAAIIVFSAVQAIESYALTPRIMGDRTGLHPLVIIVAIFFWGTALGGIWGMILAIPLTAFGVVFWRLLKEKYMQELL